MGDTTITVDESTLERFRQLKAELDEQQDSVPDHTNNLFLESLLDTWEAAEDGYYDPPAEEIVEQLEDTVSPQSVTLDATERKKIAEEIAEELR